MGALKNVLVVSSDYTLASLLETHLNGVADVHAAASDVAAFALLDSYSYACVVVDLSARSVAGSATISGLRLSALTVPVVALVPPESETVLPAGATACVNQNEPIPRVAKLVAAHCRE